MAEQLQLVEELNHAKMAEVSRSGFEVPPEPALLLDSAMDNVALPGPLVHFVLLWGAWAMLIGLSRPQAHSIRTTEFYFRLSAFKLLKSYGRFAYV